jgi:hypothetical protein
MLREHPVIQVVRVGRPVGVGAVVPDVVVVAEIAVLRVTKRSVSVCDFGARAGRERETRRSTRRFDD